MMHTVPRSFLFVPGDDERKLAKGRASGADALILDLEDSVAPERKQAARDHVAQAISSRERGGPLLYVRVNGSTSGAMLADLVAVMPSLPDGIMIPKLTSAAELARIEAQIEALEYQAGRRDSRTPLLPIVTETAAAVLGLPHLVVGAPVIGLTWGGEDLAADLGSMRNVDADGRYLSLYAMARDLCLLAAARNGVAAIDAVCTAFRDADRLTRECTDAREAGFQGKLAIHPGQVETINRIFAPQPAELAWAERVLALLAEVGGGVAALDGQMLDEPHFRRARALLAGRRPEVTPDAAEPADQTGHKGMSVP
jgi:citrate lyase subunit beta/citryl-CoA lyase